MKASSARLPGNFDSTNWYAFPFKPLLTASGFPIIAPFTAWRDDCRLVPYRDRGETRPPAGRSFLHFYLDDYRFESAWNRAGQVSRFLYGAYGALTPDFTLTADMPLPLQQWQCYRSRWCGAFWQHLGLAVVPSVNWSDRDSLAWAFDGLPVSSTLSVAAPPRSSAPLRLYRDGLGVLLDRLTPAALVIYGTHLDPVADLLSGLSVYSYPSHLQTRFSGL